MNAKKCICLKCIHVNNANPFAFLFFAHRNSHHCLIFFIRTINFQRNNFSQLLPFPRALSSRKNGAFHDIRYCPSLLNKLSSEFKGWEDSQGLTEVLDQTSRCFQVSFYIYKDVLSSTQYKMCSSSTLMKEQQGSWVVVAWPKSSLALKGLISTILTTTTIGLKRRKNSVFGWAQKKKWPNFLLQPMDRREEPTLWWRELVGEKTIFCGTKIFWEHCCVHTHTHIFCAQLSVLLLH